MEPVTVFRPATVTDEYGNDVGGELVAVPQPAWPYTSPAVMAHVGPGHVPEQDASGRVDAIESVYDVYVRGEVDVTDTDVVEIRGETCPVDGKPRVWRRTTDAATGTHIRCRMVTG